MRYAPIKDIANDLKEAMEGLKIFKAVAVATVTDHKLVLKALATLTLRPAAVVIINAAEIRDTDGEVNRTTSAGIIIIDKFCANVERGSVSIWDVVDQVAEAIEPEMADGSDPKFLTCGDRHYRPLGYRPVALEDGLNAAYIVDVEAIE